MDLDLDFNLGVVWCVCVCLAGNTTCLTQTGQVFLHPTSVNHSKNPRAGGGGGGRLSYMVYLERVQTTRVYIRDSTLVPPLAFLLFGGELSIKHEEATVTIDGWITFRIPARTAVLFKEVRRAWDSLLIAKIESPERKLRDMKGGAIMSAIAKLAEAG